MARTESNGTKSSLWVLIMMAVLVFAVVPALQAAVGGNPFFWGTVTLVIAATAWVLYRRLIAPPRSWRNQVAREHGELLLVLVRESRSRSAGVGSCRVLTDGVHIDFPDRESLVLTWPSIVDVKVEKEAIGRKSNLQITLRDDADPLVLYPLTNDGVSMATGSSPVQDLLRSIESVRRSFGEDE